VISVKRCRFFLKFIFVTGVLLKIVVGQTTAQIEHQAIERLTVMIEAATLQGVVGGAGIIIGKDSESLYIATAKHIVLIGDQPSPKINVRVRWSSSPPIPAEVTNWHPALDLAVLKVRVAPNFIGADDLWFSSLGVPERMNETDDLNVVGWPEYPDQPWQSCFEWFSFRKLGEGEIKFERGCFTNGHSGGPIVDQRWNIVGMGIRFTGDEGTALAMDRIRSAVKEIAPDLPFTLTPDGPEVGRPSFKEVAGSCGLTEAGKVYCWGDGAKNWTSKRCGEQPCGLLNMDTRLRFKSIAGPCGLTSAGRAYCWKTSSTGPAPFLPEIRFASLSIASASCGITLDGELYCWGDNQSGQLGDGTTTSRTEPVLVKGGMKWAFVEVFNQLTCGIAAEGGMVERPSGGKPTKPGKAYCWGSGADGGLGGGVPQNTLTPSPVLYDRRFVALTIGYGGYVGQDHDRHNFVCGIDEDGRGVCWGRGANPGWFKNPAANRLIPQPIAWDGTLRDVASSRDENVSNVRACAISSDATLVCWGGDISKTIVEEQDWPKLALRKVEPSKGLIEAPPVRLKTPARFARISDRAQYGFTVAGDLYPIENGKLPVIVSHCFAPPKKSFSSWFEGTGVVGRDVDVPEGFLFSGFSDEELSIRSRAADRVNEVIDLVRHLQENCRLDDADMASIVGHDRLWSLQAQIRRFAAVGHKRYLEGPIIDHDQPVAPRPDPRRRKSGPLPIGPAPQAYLTNDEHSQLRALLDDYERESIEFARWAREVKRLWER
jgi:hypothetical protein